MPNNQDKFSSWEKDFREFLDTPEVTPPFNLRESLRTVVTDSLNPSPWHIFAKLSCVVIAVSMVNIIFCPQFGLSYFQLTAVFDFFMYLGLGRLGCSAACGMFFLGSGLLLVGFVFTPDELRVLRRTEFLQLTAISAIALSGFVALGAEVFFEAAAAWLFGAIVGGMATVEVTYWFSGYLRELRYG